MVSAHEPSPPLPTNPNRPEHLTDFVPFSVIFHEFFVFLRNGDGHGNGYDHDCCGSTTTAITTLTMVTIAAAMVMIAEPKSVDRHHFHPLRTPPPPSPR